MGSGHGGPAVLRRLLLALAASTMLTYTQIVSWNPLSFVSEGRASDFSGDTANIDFCLLQGTCRRAYEDNVTHHRHENHMEYSVGWSKTPYTSKSCGCSIMIHKKFNERNIRGIRTPPPALQGKGLMERLNWRSRDIALITCYFPPRTLKKEKKVNKILKQEGIVKQMI